VTVRLRKLHNEKLYNISFPVYYFRKAKTIFELILNVKFNELNYLKFFKFEYLDVRGIK
jgi:hypothetical protein